MGVEGKVQEHWRAGIKGGSRWRGRKEVRRGGKFGAVSSEDRKRYWLRTEAGG